MSLHDTVCAVCMFEVGASLGDVYCCMVHLERESRDLHKLWHQKSSPHFTASPVQTLSPVGWGKVRSNQHALCSYTSKH